MVHRGQAATLALALAASACAPAGPGDESLLVFAAASLAEVAPELGRAFTARGGPEVRFSYGSSAALARQVAAGAPADILLSADASVQTSIEERLSGEGAALGFASNELVLVIGSGETWPAGGLAALPRLAVGDWRAGVPVGLRAREWLSERDLWEELRPRLVPCVDARATLAAVASGAAPAGVVYATDARSTEHVRVVERAGSSGPAVRYLAFELDGAKGAAGGFAAFLVGPEAAAILRRHGFTSEVAPAS